MVETGILGPEDQTELIHGQVRQLVAQNAPHRAAIIKANALLVDRLRGTPYVLQTQSTLPLDDANVLEPDFAVLSGTPDDLIDGEPDEIPLIIEVSDSTLAYDRTEKLAVYAANGLPEYWIVNLQNRTLEVYREPDGPDYRERRTFGPGASVVPQFDALDAIAVDDVLPKAS